MGGHLDWTGWILGELRFAPRAVDRWLEVAMDPSRHADWPAWIAPGPAAQCTVATELRSIEALARAREGAAVPPADFVSIVREPTRLRLRAHLGPVMFDLWGGQLAALARSAEQVGAQGEVVFLERPSHRGHRLQLDGKGPGRFGPLDDATLERWRDGLEEMASRLPPEAGEVFEGWRVPFADVHRELGGVFERLGAWGLPDHYGEGPDAELARMTEGFGVIDGSGLTVVRLQGRGVKRLLKRAGAPAIGRAWRGRAVWGELRDASGALVDRVLGWKRGPEGTWLIGSPGRGLHLTGFLARNGSPALEVDDVSQAWAALAFVGPKAADHLAALAGRSAAKLRAGRVREPAPADLAVGGVWVHAPLGAHDLWLLLTYASTVEALLRQHRDHLCGARVWRKLHEDAGDVPPVRCPRPAAA
jgi:hypothetical protein